MSDKDLIKILLIEVNPVDIRGMRYSIDQTKQPDKLSLYWGLVNAPLNHKKGKP